MSEWEKEPATSAQLVTIRDLYMRQIGWDRAMGAVHAMKDAGITKKQASEEIARLLDCKAHGRSTGPLKEEV